MVGDREKLFGDKGDRLQVAMIIVVIEEFENVFPTLIR